MSTIQQLTSTLSPALRDELRRLCRAAYGDAFTEHDLAHALGGTHIVVREAERWVAHAAVVPRDIRVGVRHLRAGYVEAVAVLPARQREGLGLAVMAAVGELIAAHYDIGVLSTGEHEFYERLGWQRAGVIPDYALYPDGRFCATTFFYKRIGEAA